MTMCTSRVREASVCWRLSTVQVASSSSLAISRNCSDCAPQHPTLTLPVLTPGRLSAESRRRLLVPPSVPISANVAASIATDIALSGPLRRCEDSLRPTHKTGYTLPLPEIARRRSTRRKIDCLAAVSVGLQDPSIPGPFCCQYISVASPALRHCLIHELYCVESRGLCLKQCCPAANAPSRQLC